MTDARADLFALIDAGSPHELAALLASEPAAATARDDTGVSALMHALYRGQRESAELLARHVPELDVFEAAGRARPEAVEDLIGRDAAAASSWSPDGFTALHFAAFFGGGGAVARSLLAAGADPNARSRNEMEVMPLHSAAAGGHDDVVAELLAASADPTARQRHGWTPLHAAAEHGDVAMVERLLAAGAEPSAATDDGRTPADLARAAGHDAIASRLGA